MHKQVVEKLADLITAAFALVAALAWNTAIQAIFTEVFGEAQTIGPMLVYAVSVTVAAVIAATWIGRVAGKEEEQQ